jgi:hypothetical protein
MKKRNILSLIFLLVFVIFTLKASSQINYDEDNKTIEMFISMVNEKLDSNYTIYDYNNESLREEMRKRFLLASGYEIIEEIEETNKTSWEFSEYADKFEWVNVSQRGMRLQTFDSQKILSLGNLRTQIRVNMTIEKPDENVSYFGITLWNGRKTNLQIMPDQAYARSLYQTSSSCIERNCT